MKLSTLFLAAVAFVPSVFGQLGYKDYDNDFLDPAYVLGKNFNSSTAAAQQSIVQWADFLAAQGPWAVTNKTVAAPTGNPHDYLSWAPYYWPNCTGLGNTTELTPQQVWVQCTYYDRDGMFNPDRLLVNNTGDFQAMSDAVFYNTLAWVLTGQSNYSANAANYIDTWFINPATAQTPNLQYSQLHRGPTGQIGDHTGLLDFKQMAKLTSAVLVLRQAKSPDWTDTLDTQMNNWTTNYLEWMTTSPIAKGEWESPNNHGSYFYGQMASLQILVGNTTAATNTIKQYFSKQWMAQITSTGEQPFESIRTHPYHYRCYNLAAMVVNAKIATYLGMNYWNATTTQGATIQTALDFTMGVTLNATDGDGPIWELYPSMVAVGATYGDPEGKYASFLAQANSNYPEEPYFFFNQNFTDSGLAAATPTASSGSPGSTTGARQNGAIAGLTTNWLVATMAVSLLCGTLIV
ncbi:chondroitin AC/alginate lyase [Athelia psychrophila]|uniref:Chondroitin AC/alginate lyase n=1 Tax=Athelia psychrophila TaxID=1759441 RepID=A0A166EKD1_9AGAM|nr:chondroitin AC/alginate lyase [Fibularhizoctonia sp. CBS 109695]